MKKQKQGTKVPQDNTTRKLAYLQTLGAIPRVGLASCVVYHDSWCGHFAGRPCNCTPDIQIQWTQPEAAQN